MKFKNLAFFLYCGWERDFGKVWPPQYFPGNYFPVTKRSSSTREVGNVVAELKNKQKAKETNNKE